MSVELRVGIEESIPWNQPTTKIPLPQNRPFPLRIGRNWPAPLPLRQPAAPPPTASGEPTPAPPAFLLRRAALSFLPSPAGVHVQGAAHPPLSPFSDRPCYPFLPFSINAKENGEQEHDREELWGKKLEHGKEDLRGVAPSLLPLASRAAHLPCLPPRRALRRSFTGGPRGSSPASLGVGIRQLLRFHLAISSTSKQWL